ncbi:hypothetical protein [Burkholderia thailandensis]|nr:hypothetical protein [Burkholderia thailandensis]
MKSYRFLGSNTDGMPHVVHIPRSVVAKCKSRIERVSFHHNHPSFSPLSFGDIALMGGNPGLHEVHAHTRVGGHFHARRNGRWRTTWVDRLNALHIAFALQSQYWKGALNVFTGALETHMFCLLLDKCKLIDYQFSLDASLRAVYNSNEAAMRQLVDNLAPIGGKP